MPISREFISHLLCKTAQEYNSVEIYAWNVTLWYIRVCPLAENSLNNLRFPKMELKEEYLHTHTYKFYKCNIHHEDKFVVNHFFFFFWPNLIPIELYMLFYKLLEGLSAGRGRETQESPRQSTTVEPVVWQKQPNINPFLSCQIHFFIWLST